MKHNIFRFTKRAVVCACALLMLACGTTGDGNDTNPNDKPEEDLSFLYIQSLSQQTEYYTETTSKGPEKKEIYTYDGRKIIKCEWFIDGNLENTLNYTYDGLTATITDKSGAIVNITEYADDTYLRVKRYESNGTRAESIYEGAKLISRKSYLGDKLRVDEVYTYDGLLATVVQTEYGDDGEVEYISNMDVKYLDETFLRVEYTEGTTSSCAHYRQMSIYDGTKRIETVGECMERNGYAWTTYRETCEYDGLKCTAKEYNYDPHGNLNTITTKEILYLN